MVESKNFAIQVLRKQLKGNDNITIYYKISQSSRKMTRSDAQSA